MQSYVMLIGNLLLWYRPFGAFASMSFFIFY